MASLAMLKSPRSRFARSINVERDSGSNAVDGYLPVGRAIDVIDRLASALYESDLEVAISITGPYGSGKSSLAIILDALMGPADDPARTSAEELLTHAAPRTLKKLHAARNHLRADEHGFIRATVTAQREPVTKTVLRGLIHGSRRFRATTSQPASQISAAIELLTSVQANDEGLQAQARTIREAIEMLAANAPILLLIDEFGKNLEAFADSKSDADLFLLQELAEWSRGGQGLPLALITLQHMAFDEYGGAATGAQRREWAKIQGRFEDIPFVDSPAQTRSLISAAFESPKAKFAEVQRQWSLDQASQLDSIGLTDLASDPELLGRCWPLHPISLAALPELCERYGQNERTLFSFLAGHEPRSVATFLAEEKWSANEPLPTVRADRLYDYFLETAANFVSISNNASRWLEIDTRIRDARGLTDAARRVLKTVGLLNLVSAGGTLRASRAIVCYSSVDGQPGTDSSLQIENQLSQLESLGLITFRDFADEYRVWSGSDFDLRSAIDVARRRLRDDPPDETLNRVLPLSPIVAARHSQTTGTLRAFERSWIDAVPSSIGPAGIDNHFDGRVLYVLGSEPPMHALQRTIGETPTIFVTSDDSTSLVEAAREVAAIDEIISTTSELSHDWVARRELLERRIEAAAYLEREFHHVYGASTTRWTSSTLHNEEWRQVTTTSASSVVSDACDEWYRQAPIVRNDLINRHELTSQAAKARRLTLEACLLHAGEENLGIDGYGPDKTLYLSVLAAYGLHRRRKDGSWSFCDPDPKSTVNPVWSHMMERIQSANAQRIGVDDLYNELARPPFGIRAGLAPILLIAALKVSADQIALYEHGTFRPVLGTDVLERLLRNPDNFELKYYASKSGRRAAYLAHLADVLNINSDGLSGYRPGSVLSIVSYLVSLTNSLPECIKRTRFLSKDAVAIRQVLLYSTEPDEMLFSEIPEALQKTPLRANVKYDQADLVEIGQRLTSACQELNSAYSMLLTSIQDSLREYVGPSCNPLRDGLVSRAREVQGRVIDPRVSKLVVALSAEIPDMESWLAYVAMTVSGVPPEAWSDDDRNRFFVAIAEVGATFRRIYALNADLDAHGEGFDAYRHIITRTDGSEVVQLVSIDDGIRKKGQAIVDDSIQHVAKVLGVDSSRARSVLMGLLAEADFKEDVAAQVPKIVETSDEKQTRRGRH